MSKQIIIDIKNCGDCPHSDHTGAFTKGGAKPCCNHPKTVESKGDDCFKRVIPYSNEYPDNRNIFNKNSFKAIDKPFRVPKRIPDWCPL